MKIRLAADLQTDSIVDGKGLRTVIWTQGCSHNCKGCHNPSTHSFEDGDLVDLEEVISSLENLEGQDGITFSGGDPMFQPKPCAILAKKAQELEMNVWVYTGFKYEELISSKNKDIMAFLNYIDVLVDGKFDIEKRDLSLEFRGSSNQRIINVKESLEKNKVVLLQLSDKKENNYGRKKEGIYI